MNSESVAKLRIYFLPPFLLVDFLADLFSVNTNFVLKSASNVTAALNGLPCLLLKPLRMPVFPLASKSVISASVSVLPAIWRNTGRAQSGLSQRTTLPYICIVPVPHLGQAQPDAL